MLKPTIAAESNPEGAPAGGISALAYGIVQSLISNIPDGFRIPQGGNPKGTPRVSFHSVQQLI